MMMLRLAAAGLASALVATPVLAQTGNSNTNPGASASSASHDTYANWSKQPGGDIWLASHLKGLDVYNQQNQKLGSIDELLMDHSGKVTAAVIDIGGFLGMGIHRVAVPFSQLHFTDRSETRAADNRAGSVTSGPAMSNTHNNAPGNPTATGPQSTGTGAPVLGTSTTAANGAAHTDNVPDRVMLNMTSDQLKSAPEFQYHS